MIVDDNSGLEISIDTALADIQTAQANRSEKEIDFWYENAVAQVIYDGIIRYIETDPGEIVRGENSISHEFYFKLRRGEKSVELQVKREYSLDSVLHNENVLVRFSKPRASGNSIGTSLVMKVKSPSDSGGLGSNVVYCHQGEWLDMFKAEYKTMFNEELVTPAKIVAYLQENQKALEFVSGQLDERLDAYSRNT